MVNTILFLFDLLGFRRVFSVGTSKQFYGTTCSQRNLCIISSKWKGIQSQWQFSIWLWTKWISVWFIIIMKSFTSIVILSIGKELEKVFSECVAERRNFHEIRSENSKLLRIFTLLFSVKYCLKISNFSVFQLNFPLNNVRRLETFEGLSSLIFREINSKTL